MQLKDGKVCSGKNADVWCEFAGLHLRVSLRDEGWMCTGKHNKSDLTLLKKKQCKHRKVLVVRYACRIS